MTIREKFKLVLDNCITNIDNYHPSVHVYYFYYDSMVFDIQKSIEDFKVILKKNLYILHENIDIIPNEEFPDIDPNPLYFIDTNNINSCFELIEYKILSITSELQMKNIMNKLYENIELNLKTLENEDDR